MSGKRDSDPRPSAWEADALPTELLPHGGEISTEFVFASGEVEMRQRTLQISLETGKRTLSDRSTKTSVRCLFGQAAIGLLGLPGTGYSP